MPFYDPFSCSAAAAAAAAAVAAAAYSRQQQQPPPSSCYRSQLQPKDQLSRSSSLKPDKTSTKLLTNGRMEDSHVTGDDRNPQRDPPALIRHFQHAVDSQWRSSQSSPELRRSYRSHNLNVNLAPSQLTDHDHVCSDMTVAPVRMSPPRHISNVPNAIVPSPVSSASQSNFYAAAACAAAVAAAVASWSGSGSPQSSICQRPTTLTTQQKSPTMNQSSPSPVVLTNRSRALSDSGGGGSGGTSVPSPAMTTPGLLPPTSPSSSSLAAAVAATLSPASAAALYQRRETSRTSTASNSAVASPYSPSVFAAAAAAHMQLLSAAAAAASFSSSLPSSSSCVLSPHCHSTMSSTTNAASHLSTTTNINHPSASRISSLSVVPDSMDVTVDGRRITGSRTDLKLHSNSGSSAWLPHQRNAAIASASAAAVAMANSPTSGLNSVTRRSPSLAAPSGVWYRRGGSFSGRSRGSRGGNVSRFLSRDCLQPNKPLDSSDETRLADGPFRGSGRRGSHITTCPKGIHIKKPLNAFMLFMKEMRARVQEECTLKESAAINQVLGKKWHELTRDEQTKYYEMARREKELHQQLYPNWSARDNYAYHARRRKRRRHLLHRHQLHSRGTPRHSRLGLSFRGSNCDRPTTATVMPAQSNATTHTKNHVSELGPAAGTERCSTQSSPMGSPSDIGQSVSPGFGRSVIISRGSRGRRPVLPHLKFVHSPSGVRTPPPRISDDICRNKGFSPNKRSVQSVSPLKDLSHATLNATNTSVVSATGRTAQYSLGRLSQSSMPSKGLESETAQLSHEIPVNMLWRSIPSPSIKQSPQLGRHSTTFASSTPTTPTTCSSPPNRPLNYPCSKLPIGTDDQFVKPDNTCPVSPYAQTRRYAMTASPEPVFNAYSKMQECFPPRMAAAAAAAAMAAASISLSSTSSFTHPTCSSLTVSSAYHRYPYFPPVGSKLSHPNHTHSATFSSDTSIPPTRVGSSSVFGSQTAVGGGGIVDLLGASRDLVQHNHGRSTLDSSSSPSTVAAVAAAAAAMAASELSGGSLKKCRARFGLEHQNLWCKPCRRKKKCIRFISDSDADDFPLTAPHLSSPRSLDHPGLRMAHLARQGLANFMDPFPSVCHRPQPNLGSYGSRLPSLAGGTLCTNREANSHQHYSPMRSRMSCVPHPDGCATSLGRGDPHCQSTSLSSSLQDPYLAHHHSPFQLPTANFPLRPSTHAISIPQQPQPTSGTPETVRFRLPQPPRNRSDDFTYDLWHPAKHLPSSFEWASRVLPSPALSTPFGMFCSSPLHLPVDMKQDAPLGHFADQTVSHGNKCSNALQRSSDKDTFVNQSAPIHSPVYSLKTTGALSPSNIEICTGRSELWRTTDKSYDILSSCSPVPTVPETKTLVVTHPTQNSSITEAPACKRMCVSMPLSEVTDDRRNSPKSLCDVLSDQKTNLTAFSEMQLSPLGLITNPKPQEVRFGVADFMNSSECEGYPMVSRSSASMSPVGDIVATFDPSRDISQTDTNDLMFNKQKAN
ncbi:uncharacterized protein DEA37_0006291 [Paragonimus westermani]|uniref:HMG box domain-containing protein n=1 Tax=Paragonimus westermani TaxID=34504 RepID=A0A5J4NXS9_9TREM|nr:uncharacterized protein DEA37_0006291 [Paragonimus westermani]